MKKVFIDGSEGTTGLRIFERFEGRDDIELLHIASDLRKDINERQRLINESDITFLCLPDLAAKEAVSLVTNPEVTIIDTSTAHRTTQGWAYGFPELSDIHREAVKTSKRIAVPGCHASGFIAIVYPLIKSGILPKSSMLTSFSITGYSGGGKKMIADYEESSRSFEYNAPRQYALNQQHKHFKEMMYICELEHGPVFSPIVCDYYSGMEVSLPLHISSFIRNISVDELQNIYSEHYKESKLIKVRPIGFEAESSGFYSANKLSGRDIMEIMVNGNDERVLITSRFDNLGKGASGAAIQCMNISMGTDETTGLVL